MYIKFKDFLQSRLGRVRYISYILILCAVFYSAIIVYRSIFGVPGDEYFIFVAAFFIAFISLSVKRLHDLNLRGWWALLPPISWACILGLFIGFAFSSPTPPIVELAVFSIYGLNALALPFLFFWKGTTGSNRFGDES